MRVKKAVKRGLQWILRKFHITPSSKNSVANLIKNGDIHVSAHFNPSAIVLHSNVKIKVEEDCIFLGKLIFDRPNSTFAMGKRSYVGPDTEIRIADSVILGDDVMVSWDCILMDHNMHSLTFAERQYDVLITNGHTDKTKNWNQVKIAPIVVESKAWIGVRSIILKGTTLGEGCIIGAGSVVANSVAPWTMVAGNPAQYIRMVD